MTASPDASATDAPRAARLRHILGQINWVLFVEEKFAGNVEDYDDPRNSYLNQVLDRKKGIPISLSILYQAVADRLGLTLSGVNLPAHFVIRGEDGPQTIFVDPFHGGTLLDRDGCRALVARVSGRIDLSLPETAFEAAPAATVVARMLRNLKAIYLRSELSPAALPVLRRLVALSRGNPEERRDLGVSALRSGRPGEAIPHLAAYVEARPDADDSGDIATLARLARRDLSSRN